jgi:hypothetical protein
MRTKLRSGLRREQRQIEHLRSAPESKRRPRVSPSSSRIAGRTLARIKALEQAGMIAGR